MIVVYHFGRNGMNMTLLVKRCGNCLVSQSKLSTSLTLPTSVGQDGQEGNIDDDNDGGCL